MIDVDTGQQFQLYLSFNAWLQLITALSTCKQLHVAPRPVVCSVTHQCTLIIYDTYITTK